MGENYATDSSGNKYRTRKDYEAGICYHLNQLHNFLP